MATPQRRLFSYIPLSISLFLCVMFFYYAYTQRLSHKAADARAESYFAILQNSELAFSILDSRGRIVWWSPGAATMFGYTAEEVLGRLPDFLMPPDVWQMHCSKIQHEHTRTDVCKTHIVTANVIGKGGKLVPTKLIIRAISRDSEYYHAASFLPLDQVVENIDHSVQAGAGDPGSPHAG
jgi:PAS domain S-box-containing protein